MGIWDQDKGRNSKSNWKAVAIIQVFNKKDLNKIVAIRMRKKSKGE